MKKPPTLPQLVKKADQAYSRYIRLRDSEYRNGQWVGECITCGRELVVVFTDGSWNPAANAGHYIGRSCKPLRWDDCNVNMQCAYDNAWRDKVDMIAAYKKGLDLKYGKGTAARLKRESTKLQKPSRQDLEQIIEDSKNYVTYTLAHPV